MKEIVTQKEKKIRIERERKKEKIRKEIVRLREETGKKKSISKNK